MLVSHLHKEGTRLLGKPDGHFQAIPVLFVPPGDSPTESITGRKCVLTGNSCAAEQEPNPWRKATA